MALTPAAMMNLRRGPTQGPTPTPGGAAPTPSAGLPATAADPGQLLTTAIAQRMSEHKKANANFAVSHLEQTQRVLGTMMVHLMQMFPDVSKDLNRAWSSLDSAKKKLNDAFKESSVPTGPPLGFAAAQQGPPQQQMAAGGPGGLGGGGMGVPS
jgi:hypothetical protein